MKEKKSDRKWIPATEVHVYIFKNNVTALPRGSGWLMQTIRNPKIPDNIKNSEGVEINGVNIFSVVDHSQSS